MLLQDVEVFKDFLVLQEKKEGLNHLRVHDFAGGSWREVAFPEPVYAALRAAGCAVFRWDRVWPGVPDFHDDHGARWRTHVLQLLCHQDLDDAMLAHTCSVLQQHLTR